MHNKQFEAFFACDSPSPSESESCPRSSLAWRHEVTRPQVPRYLKEHSRGRQSKRRESLRDDKAADVRHLGTSSLPEADLLVSGVTQVPTLGPSHRSKTSAPSSIHNQQTRNPSSSSPVPRSAHSAPALAQASAASPADSDANLDLRGEGRWGV